MNILEMEPEHIFEYLISPSITSFVSTKKEIYPSSYLDYAKEDISEGISRRTLVNALSNAKRAFHFQVDIICTTFGWEKHKASKKTSFPAKLEYLSKCGIISPNILLKLNRTRNLVEHEYTAPTEEELRDYIDIVELFLMATKGLLDSFPESLTLELMKDEHYNQELDLPEFINAKIIKNEGGIELQTKKEIRAIAITDEDYYQWLSAIISSHLI
jgi:hypothetical protein